MMKHGRLITSGMVALVSIFLSVNAGAVSVIWSGGDFTWTNPDANSFDLTYNNGDTVTFGNTGAGVITTSGTLLPASISFTNTVGNNYSFSGTSIGKTASVTLSGGGNVTLTSDSMLPVLGALNLSNASATLTFTNNERVGSLSGSGKLVGTVGNNMFRFGFDNSNTTFSGVVTQAGGGSPTPSMDKVGTGTTTIDVSLGTGLGHAGFGITDGTLRLFNSGNTGDKGTTVFPGATLLVDDTGTHVDNRTGQTIVSGEYKVLGNASANSAVGGGGNTGFFFGGSGYSMLGNPTLTLVPGTGFEAQYRQRNGGDGNMFGVDPGVTALVRGDNLAQTTPGTTRSRFTIMSGAYGAGNGISTLLIGGAGQTCADDPVGQGGTPQVSVLYRTYGDTVSTGQGSGFVTYDRGSDHNLDDTDIGVRLLTPSEYAATVANGAGAALSTIANTKLTSAVGGIDSATRINSLLLAQNGAIAGSGTLTIESGLIMSTGGNGSIATAGLTTGVGGAVRLITPNATNVLNVSSNISSGVTAGLIKSGEGTATLSGTNSYTGATYIANGALHAVNGTSLPSNSKLFFTGGVFESNGTFTRSLGGGNTNVQWHEYSSGGFAAQGGALNIQLNNGTAAVTWDAANFVQGQRSLIFGSVTADNLVDFQNGLNLGTFNPASGGNGNRTESTNRTVQVIDNPNSIADRAQISGAITGTDATLTFRKTGGGTLVLANANNTYVAPTQVAEGTLLVNGTLDTQGAAAKVTVNSGATLGGTGIINRPVEVSGTLAPGASAGTLTLGGGLLLYPASLLNYELGSPVGVNDLVHVDGAFTLDGTLNVTQLAGFGPQPGGPGIYRLFDYTGGFANNGLLIGTLGPNSSGWAGTIDVLTAGQVNLIVIPEPATLGLLALGGLVLLKRQRKP